MKRQLIGALLLTLFTTLAWGQQKFCTCQLERLTEPESDTIVYRASLTVFPEAMVQEVHFGILQQDELYYIQPSIADRVYTYNEKERNLSSPWKSLGRVASLRSSLLAILSQDLFSTYCNDIYLDNKTHDFSSVLTLYRRP